MVRNKTQPTQKSVVDFLSDVEDDQKRKDAFELLKIMESISKEEGVLWGPSLIGFGSYHYKYESGREGNFFITGFSPRKTALTLYIMSGFSKHDKLMAKLGKHKTRKSCLYIKKLSDINLNVLKELIEASIAHVRDKYPN